MQERSSMAYYIGDIAFASIPKNRGFDPLMEPDHVSLNDTIIFGIINFSNKLIFYQYL